MIADLNDNINILKEIIKAKAFPIIDTVNITIVKKNNIQDSSLETIEKSLSLESNIDADAMKKAPEVIEEFKTKIKGGYEIEADNLKQNYIDTPFPVISKLKQVLEEGKEVDIAPKQGEVTLFDFWATWCGPCQHPMAHNQEMLEKHTDWKGKVKIVGVSFDDEIQTVKERVTSKNWTLVEHYLVPGGFESGIGKHFDIQGIPFCVLVGKDGKIKLTGHPITMSLDINIQKLIDDQPISPAQASAASKNVEIAKMPNEEQLKEYVKSIISKMKPILDNAKGLNVFIIENLISEKCENISKGSTKMVIRFEIEEKFKQEIEAQQKVLNESFPDINISFRINYVTFYTLNDITTCSKCNKGIENEKHYICKDCNPQIGLCDQCLSKEEHCHALFVLYPQGKMSINKLLFDKLDSKLKENFNLEADAIFNSVRCDCCDMAPVKGIRLKCAVCANVDLCQNCIKAIDTPGSDLASIEANAKKAGHELKGHCYIRLLHPGMTESVY